MDKKIAEVLYWMAEHAAENGRWLDLCDYLADKGISAKQIATAINESAKIVGFVSGLTEDDCA